MWWSRLALVLLLAAAGCGFRPLYGERDSSHVGVSTSLAAIRIEAIPDRLGQQVYNLLRERLNPDGKPDDPAYVLRVRLQETKSNLFLESDETATRSNLTLKATYELKRAGTDEIVAKGVARAVSSFDILASQYATVVSEEDARQRSARAVSDEIRTRLALALSADDDS